MGESIATCGYRLSLLYMTCGDADGIAYEAGFMTAAEGLFPAAGNQLGELYKVVVKGGVHDFNVWNNGAYNFMRLAFETGNEQEMPREIPVLLE